ncbi:DUF1819 family protein [Sulfurimonas sp. NW15]|uniref:DUF1819 family protein n=1 Tax=Sulfurimonas sp. NW15 TaxID=2922729 RepID=UPI003DA8477B
MASKYLLSYTAVSLQAYEAEIIANIYRETLDWESVAKSVVDDDALQKGTISTRKREFTEFKKRLQTLTPEQLAYYEQASSSDVKNLTMLSCFKLYAFISDFAREIIRNKLLLFDFQLINSDYEAFYDSKRVAYDNLNTISEATKYKLKQVMFKMFEQAGFIDSVKNKNIQKPYLSQELIKLIVKDDPKYLGAFLCSDNEINEYIKRYQ